MQFNTPWFWLIMTALFIIAESATVKLVAVWYCVGSIAALVTSIFTDSFSVQLTVFLAVSVVFMIVGRSIVKKRIRTHHIATNAADSVVGRSGVVLQPVTSDLPGRVRVDGREWSAVCDRPLAAGAHCRVAKLTGVTLTVEEEAPSAESGEESGAAPEQH